MANTYITDAAATEFLDLLLNNAAWAAVGDAGGLQPSVGAGSLYLSLHTATPVGGNQTASECAYTSYARVAVARDGTKWTVAAGAASNAAEVAWPQCTGLSETATHVGIGTDAAGAGNLILVVPLTAGIAISNLITPVAAIGDIDITPE